MKHIVNIIAFVLTFAVVAFAGWDTTLFDGESKRWGYGYDRAQQCYSAVVERANATWGDSWPSNITTTPRWWGSSWTLEEAKDDIESMLSAQYWVNTAEEVSGDYVAWFNNETNSFLPRLNTSNILVNAGAPTNWFEVNPHWGAVTHSNGWEYLDDIVNEMRVIKTSIQITGQYKNIHINVDFANTWDQVKDLAEDEWAATSTSGFDDSSLAMSFTEGGYYDVPSWTADIFDYGMRLSWTNSKAISGTMEYYLLTEFSYGTLDRSQDGLLTGYATKIETATVSTSDTAIVSDWIGNQPPLLVDDMPNWCVQPDTNTVGDITSKGYRVEAAPVIMRLDANTLQYSETP